MITEQLIEDLDLPDYYKWTEHIWCDDFWWEHILDDVATEWDANGLDVDPKSFGFDIYHHECTSGGRVTDRKKFVEMHYDRLSAISPVFAQMIAEEFFVVIWRRPNRGGNVSIELQDYWGNFDTFAGGLIAGTSVEEMYDLEINQYETFEQEVADIINEYHDELLKRLTEAYEYDTSEERYKEWILEQIDDALPRHTAS